MTFDAAFRAKLRELIQWRRDVRHFRRDPLPPGEIERLLDLAALAPSVGLSQPWRFVLVEDAARRAAIRENFRQCNAAALSVQAGERQQLYARLKLAGLDDAPVQLAVLADGETPQGHGLGRQTMPEATEFSVVMAIHTLWLVARAEGLGVGWVSIIDPAEIARILDTPPSWRLIGYLCLGYPEGDAVTPELERAGWEKRRAARDFLFRR